MLPLLFSPKNIHKMETRIEFIMEFKNIKYMCFSVFISVEDDGRCFRQISVIHGESKHVSPFPMWLQVWLLTFNCSPNNAYWFLPKIFAHDWHLRHTWPVTGLLLTPTNQCPFADDGQRFGQVICFRAQLTKPRPTSITQSFCIFFKPFFVYSFYTIYLTVFA